MGRGYGSKAPMVYFTLNYYSPHKNSTKYPPMPKSVLPSFNDTLINLFNQFKSLLFKN
jgi:hypothetical protein